MNSSGKPLKMTGKILILPPGMGTGIVSLVEAHSRMENKTTSEATPLISTTTIQELDDTIFDLTQEILIQCAQGIIEQKEVDHYMNFLQISLQDDAASSN